MCKWTLPGALCVFAGFAAGQTVTFELLPDPLATFSNFALSNDGRVLAANYGGGVYRWTKETGFTFLGSGDPLGSTIGISSDGTTIISTFVGRDGYKSPAKWTAGGGWVYLGHAPNSCVLDGEWGSGYALNGDGTVAAGLAWLCRGGQASGRAAGFVWTRKDGTRTLSHPAGASSRASAISADGTSIVGFYEDPKFGNRRPVRWTHGNTNLLDPANNPGEATAVSKDGTFVAGQGYNPVTGYPEAFLYTDKAGMKLLGTLGPEASNPSYGNSVSNDGVVVGFTGSIFFGPFPKAFIWDAKNGMGNLQYYLVHHGATIPEGVSLIDAIAISGDGTTVAGQWFDTSFRAGGWIARIR